MGKPFFAHLTSTENHRLIFLNFSIPIERHKAEVRSANCDELLSRVSASVSGLSDGGYRTWVLEGRRAVENHLVRNDDTVLGKQADTVALKNRLKPPPITRSSSSMATTSRHVNALDDFDLDDVEWSIVPEVGYSEVVSTTPEYPPLLPRPELSFVDDKDVVDNHQGPGIDADHSVKKRGRPRKNKPTEEEVTAKATKPVPVLKSPKKSPPDVHVDDAELVIPPEVGDELSTIFSTSSAESEPDAVVSGSRKAKKGDDTNNVEDVAPLPANKKPVTPKVVSRKRSMVSESNDDSPPVAAAKVKKTLAPKSKSRRKQTLSEGSSSLAAARPTKAGRKKAGKSTDVDEHLPNNLALEWKEVERKIASPTHHASSVKSSDFSSDSERKPAKEPATRKKAPVKAKRASTASDNTTDRLLPSYPPVIASDVAFPGRQRQSDPLGEILKRLNKAASPFAESHPDAVMQISRATSSLPRSGPASEDMNDDLTDETSGCTTAALRLASSSISPEPMPLQVSLQKIRQALMDTAPKNSHSQCGKTFNLPKMVPPLSNATIGFNKPRAANSVVSTPPIALREGVSVVKVPRSSGTTTVTVHRSNAGGPGSTPTQATPRMFVVNNPKHQQQPASSSFSITPRVTKVVSPAVAMVSAPVKLQRPTSSVVPGSSPTGGVAKRVFLQDGRVITVNAAPQDGRGVLG